MKMKEFLSEHPVKLDGPAPQKPFVANVMSAHALAREYDDLGVLHTNKLSNK